MVVEKIQAALQMETWLKNGYVPRYLYKYKSLQCKFTVDLLRKSELYFSNPPDFNDPFDCQMRVEVSSTREDITKWVNGRHPNSSANEKKKIIKDLMSSKRQDTKGFDQITATGMKELRTTSGLCCFAGSNDNILMWSHYANCHSGICLKFDISQSPEVFITPLVVNYSDAYPVFRYFSDPLNLFETVIQTKAKCWEYEDETSIFKEKGGAYKFNPNSLVEICFGCKASSDDINRIKELIKEKRYSHVNLKQAKRSKTYFKLLIEDFSN